MNLSRVAIIAFFSLVLACGCAGWWNSKARQAEDEAVRLVDQSVRETSAYRKAMRDFARIAPNCEWCGTMEDLQTHHALSVWYIQERGLDPAVVSDTNRFVRLCRRDHLAVGHAGNFQRCVTNIRQLIELRVIVERNNESR